METRKAHQKSPTFRVLFVARVLCDEKLRTRKKRRISQKKVTKHRKIMYHEQIADEIVNDCCAVVCTTAASFTF